MPRTVKSFYQDPIEITWRYAARQCGIEVQRHPDVFAAWDGLSVLQIGTADTLDADDSLAQMILHELCHALVAGPDGFKQMDWGLDYDCPEHQVYERASLRLQAAFADEVGMRSFFASTTDFREYFDQLPADPLSKSGNDPAAALAREGMQHAERIGWLLPIRTALGRTAAIAEQIQTIADDGSLWKASADDSIF